MRSWILSERRCGPDVRVNAQPVAGCIGTAGSLQSGTENKDKDEENDHDGIVGYANV